MTITESKIKRNYKTNLPIISKKLKKKLIDEINDLKNK
jgi:hypothetical protein